MASLTSSSLTPFLLTHSLVYLLQGLLLGLFIHSGLFPYPRIALAAHIGFMGTGTLFLALSLASHPAIWPFRKYPGTTLNWVIKVGVWVNYLVPYSEIMNAFWGSKTTLPIAAAGSRGAKYEWQNTLVDLAHIIPALFLILIVGGLLGLAMLGGEKEVVKEDGDRAARKAKVE
jgi:hypothetical protein